MTACSKGEAPSPEPALKKTEEIAPRATTPPPPSTDAAEPAVVAPAIEADAGAPWAHFSSKNEVQLCMFTTYEQWEAAPFLQNVKKSVKLKAHAPLVFGIYGPGCASRECIAEPTMQCWAELEENTITVQSRYSGEQRVGATCTKDCEPVTAQCDTPNLTPGTYTIVYGDVTTKVKVPGTQRACIKPK